MCERILEEKTYPYSTEPKRNHNFQRPRGEWESIIYTSFEPEMSSHIPVLPIYFRISCKLDIQDVDIVDVVKFRGWRALRAGNFTHTHRKIARFCDEPPCIERESCAETYHVEKHEAIIALAHRRAGYLSQSYLWNASLDELLLRSSWRASKVFRMTWLALKQLDAKITFERTRRSRFLENRLSLFLSTACTWQKWT
jgi:hypothetical protein